MQHVFVELEPMPWRVSALRSARRVLFKPKSRKSFSNLTPEEVTAIVNRVKRDGPLKRLMSKLKPSLKSFIKTALNIKGLVVSLDKARKMISIGKMTRLASGFAVKQQIQVMLEQGNKLRIDGQIVRKNINGAAESVAKIGQDVVVKVKRTGVDLSGRMEIAFVQGKMWVREQASSLAKFLPAASASQIIESLRKLPENLVKVTRQADDILLKDLAGNVIATLNKKGMRVKRWVDLTYGGTVQNIKGKIREIFSGRFLAKNKNNKVGICLRDGTCFVAGTLIYVSSSFQPIEQIQAGNQVHSGDPKSCEQSPKNVEATFVRTTPILVKLGFIRENIYATPEHPFFNLRNEQILAGNLKKGDTLKTYDGYAIVQNARSIDTMATVYNFHVKDFHTYYVGKTRLWVHNMMSHGQVLNDAARAKAKNILSKDELVKFNDDLVKKPGLITKFNGNKELLEGWKVLHKADPNGTAKLGKKGELEEVRRYLDENPNKSLDDIAKEIKSAGGYQTWKNGVERQIISGKYAGGASYDRSKLLVDGSTLTDKQKKSIQYILDHKKEFPDINYTNNRYNCYGCSDYGDAIISGKVPTPLYNFKWVSMHDVPELLGKSHWTMDPKTPIELGERLMAAKPKFISGLVFGYDEAVTITRTGERIVQAKGHYFNVAKIDGHVYFFDFQPNSKEVLMSLDAVKVYSKYRFILTSH